MRMIPGATKVKMELFKKITLTDLLLGVFVAVLLGFVVTSSIPFKFIVAGVIFLIAVFLMSRINNEPNYIYMIHILRHFGYRRKFARTASDQELQGEVAEMELEESLEEAYDQPEEPLLSAKELAKVRKAEDKRLKDKKVSQEEKDAILAQRKQRIAKASKLLAEEKDAGARRRDIGEIVGFTGISQNVVEYGGKYYGAVLEIPPVEFRFFSPMRRRLSIEQGLGKILRTIHPDYAANIVKLERPVYYDVYLDQEYDKLDRVRDAYENGLLNEKELQARVEIIYDRINDLRDLCFKDKVVVPFYYLVLYDSDRHQLESQMSNALDALHSGEMEPHRLNDKELAVFLRYSNQIDFDEREIDKVAPEDYVQWAMPQVVDIYPRRVEVNHIITHNFRITNFPVLVGDAWLAGVFSMPGTKCVIKCKPTDRAKSIRNLDRSLDELRSQFAHTGVDSRRMELQTHIETLSELMAMLQQENESLLSVNVYVSAYDVALTRATPSMVQPPKSNLTVMSNMKKNVRRLYQESGMRLNNMEFNQVQAFIASQINGWDPEFKEGRGIPSNTLAAAYPWIYANVSDKGGLRFGSSDGVPVFIDFFRRDSERINSNVVIVGRSGSGKSFATKSLLSNLAADDSKIFILDPENEYLDLAANLNGKFINVGNAQQGRLNPFHIITALDDDESGDGVAAAGSYATHLQFLEEFFKQVLPDCDKEALEYLNSLLDRTYQNKGISIETDLSRLRPGDYPVFDDLYDTILFEFQQTSNEYLRSMLRVLMNYISKFSTGGRNSGIWNGPSSITTDENFTVFNFQSLLANRNMTVANAQMLLVLKYVDNEIIKNRDYNRKYGLNRKVIVVIDEAHVFIDTKYPAALDFMFQLAKRIRKYNGMQVVITQNIKDFVGSEEIARKSTAIINACQYSLIFSMAPSDMTDLCKLYEKAGGINENEQEQIMAAPRGQAFAVMGPASRSSFKVEAPEDIVDMFSKPGFVSRYFSGEQGEAAWEEFLGDSRKKRSDNGVEEMLRQLEDTEQVETTSRPMVAVMEMDEEEARQSLPVYARTKVVEEVAVRPPQAAAPSGRIQIQEIDSPPERIQIQEIDSPPGRIEIQEIDSPSDFVSTPARVSVSAPAQVSVSMPSPAPVSSGVEQLLSDLVGKFSYDAMQAEIRRMVQKEMEETLAVVRATVPEAAAPEGAAVPAAEGAAMPVPAPFPRAAAEVAGEAEVPAVSPVDSLLASLAPGPEAAAATEEEAAVTMDIMAVLALQAQAMEEFSPMDMMEAYDEPFMDITLEELARYNASHK